MRLFILLTVVLGFLIQNGISFIIDKGINSSRVCKNECIDKTLTFCPTNSAYSKGTCCTEERCPDSIDICSSEPKSMIEMRYQACPKEPWCGNYYINPSTNGEPINIRPEGDAQYIYFNGAMCTY